MTTDKQVYAPGERAKDQIADSRSGSGSAINRRTTLGYRNRPRQSQADYFRWNATSAARPFPSRHFFNATNRGPHLIERETRRLSTSDTEAKSLFDVSEGFRVEIVPLESVDTTADLEGMEKLASATGGMNLDHPYDGQAVLQQRLGRFDSQWKN